MLEYLQIKGEKHGSYQLALQQGLQWKARNWAEDKK